MDHRQHDLPRVVLVTSLGNLYHLVLLMKGENNFQLDVQKLEESRGVCRPKKGRSCCRK